MKSFLRYAITVLMLLSAVSITAQTIREQYKAKKKDTVYGISRKYGITIEELTAANPQLATPGYQLKKGEVLNIPEAKAMVWVDGDDALKELFRAPKSPLRVGVMLPLHQTDADGRRMVEYYRGFLMGCDSLKASGLSVDIHTWNVDEKADIRTTLLEKSAADCDIIFGPYYSAQVESNEEEKNPYVFKVYQSAALQSNMAVSAFLERFPSHHPVFIDCQDATSKKGIFTAALRQKLDERGVAYNLTSLASTEEQFAKAFSRTQANVVILNSGRQEDLRLVFAKMESLTASVPGLYISVYGYTEWLMYASDLQGYYHKYDTYVPTNFYYNSIETRTRNFETAYRNWFKVDQQPVMPHYAAQGFDHARFFLKGLAEYGNAFLGNSHQNQLPVPLQSPLRFKRATEQGGFMNDTFMLIHYQQDKTIVALSY